MYSLRHIARLYITVLGTGDMQTGFCRNGINSKASKDALIILRGFSIFKGWTCDSVAVFKVLVYHGFPKRLKRTPKLYALGMMASEPQKTRVAYIDTIQYKTYLRHLAPLSMCRSFLGWRT